VPSRRGHDDVGGSAEAPSSPLYSPEGQPTKMDASTEAGERRISSLFSRWSTLNPIERLELKRLWGVRMRAAKAAGKLRRRGG
jgi:hypothetical protein